MRKAKLLLKVILLFAACAMLVVFSKESREGVSRGLEMCLGVLVPSLFPFMALSNLFIKTGLCSRLGRLLEKPTRLLFGLSGSVAPVILLGLIGGYPVGAGGLAQLKHQGVIDEEEARRAALFTVCAGPGFVINFVGSALYGRTDIGMIMFTAQVISVLITGIVSRLLFHKGKIYHSILKKHDTPLPFDTALVESVLTAAKGMTVICSFVLAFSAGLGILERFYSDSGLLILFEVCSAVTSLAPVKPVEWVAFAVGFGGLCVHFQIFAALGRIKVNKLLFFLFRMIQGLITALFTHIGLKQLHISTAVFSTASTNSAAVYGGSIASGAALAAVSICFLISLKEYKSST